MPIKNGAPGGNPLEQVIELGKGYIANFYRAGERPMRDKDGFTRYRPQYIVDVVNKDGRIVESFIGSKPSLEELAQSYVRCR